MVSKKMVIRRIVLMVLVVGLILAMCCTLSFAQVGNTHNADLKLSDELVKEMKELGEDERLKVYVVLFDLDDELVMNAFEQRYPEEYDEYIKSLDIDVSNIMGEVSLDTNKDMGFEDLEYIDPVNGDLLQTAIELKREIYREFYYSWNHDVIDKYTDSENQIYVSQYSQMSILNLSVREINSIVKDDHIAYIELFTPSIDKPEMAVANECTRADYVRDTFGNKGSGVKIGELEANNGVPILSDPFLSNANINSYSSPDMDETVHATMVARILVGSNYGLAPLSILYCRGYSGEDDYYGAVEYLLSCGVNVINLSAGNPDGAGSYSQRAKWTDHIAYKHDVHFVAAAGNEGEGNTYVMSPATGYNVICVGGYNTYNTTNNGLHSFYSRSSYGESVSSGRAEKPNLIAPASTYNPTGNNNATCGLDFIDYIYRGTSFAAPQVTGVIAQLCSLSSALKTRQSAMGAILVATCEHKINRVLRTGSTNRDYLFVSSDSVSGSSQQISNKEGAGKLDARNARWTAYNGKYWRYTVSTSDFPYTKTFTQSASTSVLNRVAIFWLRQNTLSTPHATGNLTVGAFDDLDLEVMGPNGVSVGTCKTSYSNFEVVQFVPTVGGTYTIKVTIFGTPGNSSEYLGIAIW